MSLYEKDDPIQFEMRSERVDGNNATYLGYRFSLRGTSILRDGARFDDKGDPFEAMKNLQAIAGSLNISLLSLDLCDHKLRATSNIEEANAIVSAAINRIMGEIDESKTIPKID